MNRTRSLLFGLVLVLALAACAPASGANSTEIGPLEPGEYYFGCDVHTNRNGGFVVEA